jgi:hypothetical protein
VSQPQPYSPQHTFVSDSATLANFPGQSLDVEFNNVKATSDQVLANLALIQRDDGALKNGSVSYDTLAPALQTNGLSTASAWLTATNYTVDATVYQNSVLYRCLVAHMFECFRDGSRRSEVVAARGIAERHGCDSQHDHLGCRFACNRC